ESGSGSRLFFRREIEDPLRDDQRVSMAHLRLGRHGNRSPAPASSILDDDGKIIDGALDRQVALAYGFERRSDALFVDLMATEAYIGFGALQARASRRHGRQRQTTGQQEKDGGCQTAGNSHTAFLIKVKTLPRLTSP